MKSFKDIDLKLCHSCGTCVSVCPSRSISMINGLPQLVKDCVPCGLCYESCPGIEFRYSEFNKQLFGTSDVDEEMGYYRSIYVGHATNEATRSKGASGGVITALLSGLLRRGEIVGAIVVSMDKKCPWVPRAKIATSEAEIFEAAQSKYSIVPVNEILNNLDTSDGDLAFVGLPCHIHGIRKLKKIGWRNAERIKYCIGTFCGFNMEPRATDFIIKKLKVKKEDIESLEYRGGDWPGGFRLKTKDGRKYFVEKHIYNYLNLMFVPKRCLVCPDLTNEFADVAVGDAWNKNLSSPAWSTIIVRTEKGQEIIDGAVGAKDINVNCSDKGRVQEGHSQIILYKKKGVFLRQRWLGMNPDFNLRTPSISIGEKAFNAIFFCLISFMRTNTAIFAFKISPLKLPGTIGKYARAAINAISRPRKNKTAAKKKDGLFRRIKMEYKFLRMKEWRLSDIGDHWDSIGDYDDINKETYSYFRRFIDGYRFSSLSKNSYVLDICARTGNGTLFFWEKGIVGDALCADFSSRMQSVCAERLKKTGIHFQQRLIESIPLPFKEREFDVVLCFETVEHIPQPHIFIKELGRVVKKEGQLVLTTPNHLWRLIHSLAAVFNLHHSEGPCRFISRGKLRKYLRDAGFDIINEKTTVLIPAGPRFLTKFGEYLENRIGEKLMNVVGLRQIYICRKK